MRANVFATSGRAHDVRVSMTRRTCGRNIEPMPARPRHPLTEPRFGYRRVGLETVGLTDGLRDAALSGLDR